MFVLLGLPLNVFGVLHSFYVWSYVESILGLSPYFVCFWINPVRSKSSQFLALVWFGFFFFLSSFLWFKGVFGKHPLGLFLVVFISRKIVFFGQHGFRKNKKNIINNNKIKKCLFAYYIRPILSKIKKKIIFLLKI